MWTCLSIAILARVLLASNQADFQGANSPEGQVIRSDSSDGESPDEISSLLPTVKPIPNTDRLRLKEGDILQGESSPEGDDSSLYNGKTPFYTRMSIGGLASLIRDVKSVESQPKNDYRDQNKQDKRSRREFGRSDSPPGSWIPSTTNLGDKNRGPFQERADPWQEIRKSRAFSPWGGKRVAVLGQSSKVRRPIRVPFNSWGGKRGYEERPRSTDWRSEAPEDLQKRTRFSSWGGKRGDSSYLDDNKLGNDADEVIEKRTKFNAWGGKRSKNVVRDEEEVKRTRFNAWGGKRSDLTEKRNPEEVFAKKSVFNAWGGKRFATEEGKASLAENNVYEESRDAGNESGVNFLREGEGRAARLGLGPREVIESSGGGKYLEEDAVVDPEVYYEGEIMALPDRRGGGKHLQRIYFNPWGGKKRSLQGAGAASAINFVPPLSNDLERLDRQVQSW